MFINFTNHPSDKWSDKQKKEAKKYGEIIDIPFPAVSTESDENEISNLAKEQAEEILRTIGDDKNNSAVLCQGEFTLSYAVIQYLMRQRIKVLSAVSERVVTERRENNIVKKESQFEFKGFREYVQAREKHKTSEDVKPAEVKNKILKHS
jgi:hypothetical protein